jgi:hypothetical protein
MSRLRGPKSAPETRLWVFDSGRDPTAPEDVAKMAGEADFANQHDALSTCVQSTDQVTERL